MLSNISHYTVDSLPVEMTFGEITRPYFLLIYDLYIDNIPSIFLSAMKHISLSYYFHICACVSLHCSIVVFYGSIPLN